MRAAGDRMAPGCLPRHGEGPDPVRRAGYGDALPPDQAADFGEGPAPHHATGVTRLFPVLLLLAGLAIAPAMLLTAAPPAQGPWLVVIPPWADAPALLARAGARPVGPSVAPFALMADGPEGSAATLTASGAWAVLDARRIAAICGIGDPAGE